MAITVTPKYKPFTYDELVKPLEGYWKDYDEAEEELNTLQNDISKVKAIIETAPENDPVRIQALDLYKQLQTEADRLSTEGYTSRGKKARLDLKNTYNSLIPRILDAEEAVRKDRNSYAALKRSGHYIMANDSDNPFSYTWSNYIDGQIPDYTIGVEKAKAYKAGKDASTLISSRVVGDPTFASKNGYTAITTKLGLQYANADEMMQNKDIASAIENIVNDYTQGPGWSDTAKEAVRQEVIRGAYEGLVHKTDVQYKRDAIPIDPSLTLETRYTEDGNIAYINPKTGKVVRTETPEGVIVNTSNKEEENYMQKALGTEAIPIGDVRAAGRVSKRKDYLPADGNLTTSQLTTKYGDTKLGRREKVRLATAPETQNALQNLIKDVIRDYEISGFKSQAEAIDYINNNYIVMIEGGKGIGSQDNHVYAVPIEQAVTELINMKDYKPSKEKLQAIRDAQPKGSHAYEAFDDAYIEVNCLDYATELSKILKEHEKNNTIGSTTLEKILKNENLTGLGLTERQVYYALTKLDKDTRNLLKKLSSEEDKETNVKKEDKKGQAPVTDPTQTITATMR